MIYLKLNKMYLRPLLLYSQLYYYSNFYYYFLFVSPLLLKTGETEVK
jgi:hypothetical protein